MTEFIPINPFSYEKPQNMKMSEYLYGLYEFYNYKSSEEKKDEFFLNHQKIISRFLSPYTLFKDILIIHDMGTGKSGVVSAVFEEYHSFYGFEVNFVYLSNNEVTRSNFLQEFLKLSPTLKKLSNKIQENTNHIHKFGLRHKKIRITDFNIFISFYSNSNLKTLDKKIKNKEKMTIIFIDEVHNLIQNRWTEDGKKVKEGFLQRKKINQLMSFIKSFPHRRTVYLTGTPMRHTEMELLPLLSLLSEEPIPNDLFHRSDWKVNLEKIVETIHVSYFRNRSDTNIGMNYKKGDSQFEAFNKNMFYNVYFQQMDSYQSDFYLKELFSNHEGRPRNCMDCRFLHRHAITVEEDILLETLDRASDFQSKMAVVKKHSIIFYQILRKIYRYPSQKIFIYSKYIQYAGTILLEKILKVFGKENGVDYIRLTNRGRDKISREKSVKEMVDKFNKSDSIKIIIGTDNHSESLTFLNIEQIHIISPWWNYGKMKQVCGRGNRLNSHAKLIQNKKKKILKAQLFDHYTKSKKSCKFFDYLKNNFCKETDTGMDSVPDCRDEDSYIKHILEENNYDLEKFGIQESITIEIKIYLHCAMPDLQKFSRIKKQLFPVLEDNHVLPDDFFHDILQYKKYVSSSYHENKIKEVMHILYKNSIDYLLNFKNNRIYSNDQYFKNINEEHQEMYPETISKINHLDIFHYHSVKNQDIVKYFLSESFQHTNESIFVEEMMQTIQKNTTLHLMEIAFAILTIISKRIPILQDKYLGFKNDYLYLFSDVAFQDIFIQDTNHYHLPLFHHSSSSTSSSSSLTPNKANYNLETIKEKLNVKRKLSQISKDLKIENLDNHHPSSMEKMETSTINCIKMLPKKMREKFITDESTIQEKQNVKKNILQHLFENETFSKLYFSSEKNIIGIHLTQCDKFLIYIFHPFDINLKEKENQMLKARILKLLYTKDKNNLSSVVSKKFRKEKDNHEIGWDEKYKIILYIMQEYEKNMELQIFQLPWEDVLTNLQSYLESHEEYKIYGWKKIFNIHLHNFRNKSIKIDGKEILIEKHFEYTIWIHLQIIQYMDGNLSESQRHQWKLFCREYIHDKRMDSTGRNVNTLYFQNLYDIFTNYFTKEDTLEISSELSAFETFLTENNSKSQRMKNLKISKWRKFLVELLQKKDKVWNFNL